MAQQIKIEPVTTQVSITNPVTEITANLALADTGSASVTVTPQVALLLRLYKVLSNNSQHRIFVAMLP